MITTKTSSFFCKLLLLISALWVGTGCTEVIDASLLADQPRVVINGLITDQPGPYYIRLTYSIGNLTLPSRQPIRNTNDDLSDFEPISDALVILKDNIGNTDTLENWRRGSQVVDTSNALLWHRKSTGFYVSKNFPQAKAGVSYYLRVEHKGKVYTAQATMPLPCPPIQVGFKATPIADFPLTIYDPVVSFQEPQDSKNYYRLLYLKQSIDSTSWLEGSDHFWPIIHKGFFVVDDQLLKPKVKDLKIPTPPGRPGDAPSSRRSSRVRVLMYAISKEAYDFFASMRDQQKNNEEKIFSAAPASPPSNIEGGALGFFTVAASSPKWVMSPQN